MFTYKMAHVLQTYCALPLSRCSVVISLNYNGPHADVIVYHCNIINHRWSTFAQWTDFKWKKYCEQISSMCTYVFKQMGSFYWIPQIIPAYYLLSQAYGHLSNDTQAMYCMRSRLFVRSCIVILYSDCSYRFFVTIRVATICINVIC